MIGSNKLSSLYIDLLRAYAPERYRVIAVLDDQDGMVGRSIAGVRVLAPSNHLLPVMQEFQEHGIELGRVIVGGDRNLLSEEALTEIEDICDEQEIKLDFVPQLDRINHPARGCCRFATPVFKLRTCSNSTLFLLQAGY